MQSASAAAVVSTTKNLVEISDKLGVIQAIKSKLVAQPDPAAATLLAALAEISKIYLAFETEITTYLSLTLEPDHLREERASLLSLEAGQLAARMRSAKGHCSRIWNVYERYLNPWFQRILNPNEVAVARDLFQAMETSDVRMVDVIDKVAEWLAKEASKTLSLVDDNKLPEARKRIAKARAALFPARRIISAAMRRLFDLEGDFIAASGAI
jgi:hypothetical protein